MTSSPYSSDVRQKLREAWKLADSELFDDATRIIDEVIALEPNRPDILTTKAHFLRQSKHHEEAERLLRYAITLDRSCERAWTELGLLYRDQSNFEKAAFCFQESARIKPHHSILTLLANVELAFDPESALLHAEEALRYEPTWREALVIRDAARKALTE